MSYYAELQTNILIVGGGLGGCAAALVVCRNGRQAILTEPTDWIGGQLTSQAVPPDEHGWIERCGRTASYSEYRRRVRAYYHDNYPLTDAARAERHLNPGAGWVSPICHEPRVALAVLQLMLAPYLSSGRLTILCRHLPVDAETGAEDRVLAVTLRDLETGDRRTVTAKFFLDATELGDLLPLAGVEFISGSESQAETGEPNAKEEADPTNAQGFTYCFAVDHLEGQNHTLERPAQYNRWRDFVPDLDPPWSGTLLRLAGLSPRTLEPVSYRFDPNNEPNKAFAGLWTYRRILARDQLQPGCAESDICLINWPMTDYLLGDLGTCGPAETARHLEDAKQMSLSMLYWLQTEAPRRDGGVGFPGLRLRRDVVGTEDGLAKYPYIRESRRIRAEFTVCEQHLSANLRPGHDRAEFSRIPWESAATGLICTRRSAVTTTWMCRRCPSRFRWGRSSRSASRT